MERANRLYTFYSSLVKIAFLCSYASVILMGKHLARWIVSLLYGKQPYAHAEHYRSAFQQQVTPTVAEFKDHTHGKSAAARSAAVEFAKLLAARVGLEPYFYQRSRSDERNRLAGNRTYYWVKDLGTTEVVYDPPERSLLVVIDVDYYLDMHDLLAYRRTPVLLYTLQPGQAARASGEYSYTFTQSGKLRYSVSGGAEYEHPLWNYRHDSLYVGNFFSGLAYLVDRRAVDQDHSVILLTPLKAWGLLNPLPRALSGPKLERLDVVQGDFACFSVQRKDARYVTIARHGEYACVTVPAATLSSMLALQRISAVDISVASVVRETNDDRQAAIVLVDYIREQVAPPKEVVFPAEVAVRKYAFDPSTYEDEPKAVVTAYMSPLVHEAFAPLATKANEQRAVDGRVKEVATDIRPTKKLLSYIHEYVQLLIPKPLNLGPVEVDEVYARQHRATQQRILANAELYPADKETIDTFIKGESYGEIKDPRVISTLPPVTKLEYSRYIYSAVAVLEEQSWYAFCKNPATIAARVAAVCMDAKLVLKTDLSRFDGRVSEVLLELERCVLMRAIALEHHEHVLALHAAHHNRKAKTRAGIKYDTKTSRLSGGADTAFFNSIANSFIAYMAHREAGCTPTQAWAKLGIYGGDDGLTPDLDGELYTRVALSVGQVLTCEPVPRGQLGVAFLARMYGPYVWDGDTNSCCDIARQLSKLHTTPNLPGNVRAEDKLLQKLAGYILADSETPVVGDLCILARDLSPHEAWPMELDERIATYYSRYPAEVQYRNQRAPWMFDILRKQMPTFDWPRFLRHLTSCRALEDMLRFPLCAEPSAAVSKRPVVIDGDVIGAGK